MARRHIDNEPLVLARGDIFKLLRYDMVVGPCNKFRPHLPHVLEKIVLASLYFFKLGEPQLQLQPAFGYFGSLCTKDFSQSPSSLRNSCTEASACFLLRVYFFRFLTTRILNIEVRSVFAIGFFFDCFT